LPAKSAIIDAEIVVCDSDGKPDFKALMDGAARELCAWCFDLLEQIALVHAVQHFSACPSAPLL
jgi:ATP-dependent DNA ligase